MEFQDGHLPVCIRRWKRCSAYAHAPTTTFCLIHTGTRTRS